MESVYFITNINDPKFLTKEIENTKFLSVKHVINLNKETLNLSNFDIDNTDSIIIYNNIGSKGFPPETFEWACLGAMYKNKKIYLVNYESDVLKTYNYKNIEQYQDWGAFIKFITQEDDNKDANDLELYAKACAVALFKDAQINPKNKNQLLIQLDMDKVNDFFVLHNVQFEMEGGPHGNICNIVYSMKKKGK